MSREAVESGPRTREPLLGGRVVNSVVATLEEFGRRISSFELRQPGAGVLLPPGSDANLERLEQAAISISIHRGGRILYLNPAAARLIGHPRGEVIGSPVLRFVAPGSAERVRERLKRLSSDATEAEQAPVDLVHADGHLVHTLGASLALEHEGERFILTLFTDVSGLRRVQEALVESEGRYRMLAENAQDLVAEINERGEILFTSPSHMDLLGYSEEQLSDAYPLGLTHPDDLPAVRRQFERMLEGRTIGRMVHRLRRNDGSYRWFESTARPFRTGSGALHVVTIARDVTERQLYAERLQREIAGKTAELSKAKATIRELQARLIRLERTGGRDDIAGSVAHAIGNPLTALRGTVEMALEARAGRDPTLERVAELALRIQGVVGRTLDLLRDGALELGPGAPSSIAQELREEIAERAERQGVRVEIKVEPGLPLLQVDRTSLLSALVNVAENALDAMPRGGTLRLVTEPVASSSAVAIRISDTGPGMAPELREKASRPFFTTKTRASGLGLSIAASVARAHRGQLQIETAPGGGASVSIELPVS